MTVAVFNNLDSYVVKSAIFWLINVILILNSSLVFSNDLWSDEEFDAFCRSSNPVATNNLQTSLRGYFRVVKEDEGMDLSKIKLPTFEALSSILSKAIQLNWSALELFTDRRFTRGNPCIIFLDSRMLQQVDAKYDLHPLWMINPPIGSNDKQKLAMEYLLLGDGKLIVGYPRGATVKVRDYDIATGRYAYQPYTSMDIIHDRNARGLFHIHVRERPTEEPSPFMGPLLSKISAMEVVGGDILVHYTGIFSSKLKERFLARILIEKRQ